jgi:ferric-dicitrate binding protein FerR (iron transport regulator)
MPSGDGLKGRPEENSGRPFSSATREDAREELAWQLEQLAGELELAERKEKAAANKLWRQSRRLAILGVFWVTFVGGIIASYLSINTLMTSSDPARLHVATWALETIIGAVVAGFIGFLMAEGSRN